MRFHFSQPLCVLDRSLQTETEFTKRERWAHLHLIKNIKSKELTNLSYTWKKMGRRCTEQHTYNLRTDRLLQITLCVCKI